MEFLFELTSGVSFSMVVDFNDTVALAKLKIQESRGIPVLSQSLIYRDEVLDDETDFTRFHSFKGVDPPCILLVIAGIPPDELLLTEAYPDAPPPETLKVPILFQMPISKHWRSIQIDIIHTVGKLKEIIQGFEGVPASRIVIHYPGDVELDDDRKMLMECEIAGFVKLAVSYRPQLQEDQELMLPPDDQALQPPRKRLRHDGSSSPSPVPPMSPLADGEEVLPEIMNVFLAPFGEMFRVEVLPGEKVVVLRQEWERWRLEQPELGLPEGDEIKFSYGGRILDENETFQQQLVKDGAIIISVQVVDPKSCS